MLLLLVAGCGFLMLRSPNRRRRGRRRRDQVERGDERAADLARRRVWVGLAAVPSGLLIAVTAHIATDVASVPLFWVIPLALYLLTFVIVFQTRRSFRIGSWSSSSRSFVLLLFVVDR